MNRETRRKVTGVASIVVGATGAAFTLSAGDFSFSVLFLAVAVLGVGTYTELYRVTMLSLAVGACAAVLTAGTRFVLSGSLDLLTAALVVLAATMGWKIRQGTRGR